MRRKRNEKPKVIERKRLKKPKAFGDRILQAEVVHRIIREFEVSQPTAIKWLREYGPPPIERKGQRLVWFRKSEIDEWLSEGDEK